MSATESCAAAVHLQAAQADLQEHVSFEELAGAHRAKIAALQKQVVAAQQEAGAASDEAATLRGRLRQAQAGLSALEDQLGTAVQAEAQGEGNSLIQGWGCRICSRLVGGGCACGSCLWERTSISSLAAVAGRFTVCCCSTPTPGWLNVCRPMATVSLAALVPPPRALPQPWSAAPAWQNNSCCAR